MLSQDKIARINELSQRAKTTGLTESESIEQHELREEYLQSFRSSFKDQLHSVKVVDPEGADVTPEKLDRSKKERKVYRSR